MKGSSNCCASTSLGLLLARLPVGATLIFTGYHKIVDVGIRGFVAGNLHAVPGYMPPDFGKYYLAAVPVAEVVLGILLALGFLTRITSLLTALMLASFMIAVTGVMDPSRTVIVNPTALYLTLAVVAMLLGGGRFSLDSLLWGKKSGKGGASH